MEALKSYGTASQGPAQIRPQTMADLVASGAEHLVVTLENIERRLAGLAGRLGASSGRNNDEASKAPPIPVGVFNSINESVRRAGLVAENLDGILNNIEPVV